MNIKGSKILLRALEESDLENLRFLINDSETEYSVVGWSFPISQYEQRRWFENQINSNVKRFIVESLDSKTFVGMLILSDLDWKNRTALIGIKLDSRFRGQGFGYDCYKTLLKYCFEKLQLHKIESCCLEDNLSSLNLHLKCGFKKEGLKREVIFKKGKYHNIIILGLLHNEFFSTTISKN